MNQWHYNKIKQLKDWERDLRAVLVFKNDMDEETRNDTIRYRDLLVYAIEQAEKLQELRKRYLTLTKENNQVNDELIDEFRKNKRYWEFINNIKTASEQPISYDELLDVIQSEYKVLEESK